MERTFLEFQSRKLARELNGIHDGSKGFTTLWTFLVLLLILGFAAAGFTDQGTFEFKFKLSPRDFSFASLAAILSGWLLVYSLTQLMVLFRWLLYWLLAAEALLFFLKRDLNLWGSHTPTWLVIGLMVLELLTLIIYATIHFLYPWLLRSKLFEKKIGAFSWWKVRVIESSNEVNQFSMTYNSRWLNRSQRNVCRYTGPVDRFRRPHGLGYWMDDSPNGEILSGYFEKGVPVGPFKSREFGTGYAVESVLVGFATCLNDKFNKPSRYSTKNHEPTYGLAAVECSVAGSFFTHLPTVLNKKFDTTLADVLGGFHIQSESKQCSIRELSVKVGEDGTVNILGHERVNRLNEGSSVESKQIIIDVLDSDLTSDETNMQSQTYPNGKSRSRSLIFARSEDRASTAVSPNTKQEPSSLQNALSQPLLQNSSFSEQTPYGAFANSFKQTKTRSKQVSLAVRQWKRVSSTECEALIFFPGFNASAEKSLKRLGQLMSIGNFPENIVPFVFLSIGHTVSTYIPAVWNVISEETVSSFSTFLLDLENQNIRKVHFLAHSLGVQSVIRLCQLESISKLFIPSENKGTCKTTAGKLELVSVTLNNGDFPLGAFVTTGYMALRKICSLITVVGNLQDNALFWSEVGNGVGILMDHYLGTETQPPELRSEVCLRSTFGSITQDEAHAKEVFGKLQPTIGRQIHSLFEAKDAQTLREDVKNYYRDDGSRSPRTFNRTERQIAQYHFRSWMDIDAIDTTMLQRNVHSLRHNYFNLNHLVVEDLQEIIVTKQRAKHRSSLLHREGNIFTFCQAPSFVVND